MQKFKMDLHDTSRYSVKEQPVKVQFKKKIEEEDQDFVPMNFKVDQKERGQKKKRRPRECYKLWECEENKIFLEFLLTNRASFEDLLSRRANKVFVNMAKLFPERNSHQCKSHYQKLQKMTKNKSISQVIKFLEKKLKQEKVLHQKIIRGGQTGFSKSKEIQSGKMNIYHINQKCFEIQIHMNCDLISSW